ncbi:hypothetical protein BDZ45DRAFT_776471 [Acephala macrosclerotiorum]|nr:hypothetical protein BDZ45DRAFT_776471 [Acephala macrosclerotiorum]
MDDLGTPNNKSESFTLAKRTIKGRKVKARKAKRDKSKIIHSAYGIPIANPGQGGEGVKTPSNSLNTSVPSLRAISRKQNLARTRQDDFKNAMAQLQNGVATEARDVDPKEESESAVVGTELATIKNPEYLDLFAPRPPKREKPPLAVGETKGKIYILSNDPNEPPLQGVIDIAKNEKASQERRKEDNARFLAKLNAAAKKIEKEKEDVEASGWVVVERGGSLEGGVDGGVYEVETELVLGGGWVDWIREIFRWE